MHRVAFAAFYLCFDQMQNNLISQAANMETHVMPNDVMPALNQVACIILGPLIQSVLYPFLQRRNIPFRPIAKITVGFAFVALSMLYATILQQFIYTDGPCYNHPGICPGDSPNGQATARFKLPNHINIWIQAPVYIFIAIGEIFAYVTGLEYAYDNSPHGLKAIVQAFSLLVAALGSAGAMGFSPLARDPYLVAFYACLTIAITVTAVIFWWVFSKYDEHLINEDNNLDLETYIPSTDAGSASSLGLNQTSTIEKGKKRNRIVEHSGLSLGTDMATGVNSPQARSLKITAMSVRGPTESGTEPAKNNETIARGILETLNTTNQWTPPDNRRVLDTKRDLKRVTNLRQSPSTLEAAKGQLKNLGLTLLFSTKASKKPASRSLSANDLHHGKLTLPTEHSGPQRLRRTKSTPVVSL